MQGNIGSVKAEAWVEHILSRIDQVSRDSKLNGFTEKLGSSLTVAKPLEIANARRMETISGNRSSGTKISEGPGQPARQLNHVVPATRSPQTNQNQTVYRRERPVSDELTSSDSESGMVSLSPVPISPVPERQQERHAADRQVVQRDILATEPRLQSPANLKEAIADRVYHLMQKDLLLERDRANRVGG